MRFFNTTGPCNPVDHYMLPATERLEAFDLDRLLAQKSYFVLHAPRQTGKTSAMLELARQLTTAEEYVGVLVSMEVGAGFPDDIGAAEEAILGAWRRTIHVQLPKNHHPLIWQPDAPAGQQINEFLSEWALQTPLPIVIFIDEIDALQDHVLISELRQLRAGFNQRPTAFPSSIALIGLRDVRDYKVKSGGSPHLSTPSPFNISVRSFTLRNFTADEVRTLLGKHTTETRQAFTDNAVRRIFELTQGQPWLVNALAKICMEELVEDVTIAVDLEQVGAAKEILIQRRQTHLHQLADKLREERVRNVIEPMLAGGVLDSVSADDLDDAFLTFWRQHGQPLLRSAPCHEIAPHIVLMAFLHRVVNLALSDVEGGNGRIEREYAIGSRRMDLCLFYGDIRLAMELKVWRDGDADPITRGLGQLDSYLDCLGLATGWLVIFDQWSGLPEISQRTTTAGATTPRAKP